MTLARQLTAAVAATVSLAVAACQLESGSRETYLIAIDSILAPDSISTSESLPVRFLGYVGPNGCYRFYYHDMFRVQPDTALFAFHGEFVSGPVCTQAIVELDFTQVIAPPMGDPFVIRVRQPGGAFLSKSVIVR